MGSSCEEYTKVRLPCKPNSQLSLTHFLGHHPQRSTPGQRRNDSWPQYLCDRESHQTTGDDSGLLGYLRSATAQQQTHRRRYAKSGEWLVYLLDFFEGDLVPLKTADVIMPVDAAKQSSFAEYAGMLARAPSFGMWMTRRKEGPTNKVCMDFLQAFGRETPGSRKIGMVGCCWGGKYAIQAGLESNMIKMDDRKLPLVDAVVILHLSYLAFLDDVEALIVPVSVSWGLEDVVTKIEQKGKVEEIHAKARQMGRKLPEIEHKVYMPGRHGLL